MLLLFHGAGATDLRALGQSSQVTAKTRRRGVIFTVALCNIGRCIIRRRDFCSAATNSDAGILASAVTRKATNGFYLFCGLFLMTVQTLVDLYLFFFRLRPETVLVFSKLATITIPAASRICRPRSLRLGHRLLKPSISWRKMPTRRSRTLPAAWPAAGTGRFGDHVRLVYFEPDGFLPG